MSSDEPLCKKKKDLIQPKLNKYYFDDAFTSQVQHCFATKKHSIWEKLEQGEVNVHPYFHIVLNDFVQDEDFIDQLETELCQLEYKEKNNDLYKFHQSADLKHVSSPSITAFCQILETKMKDWLCKISEIDLNEEVDVFASRYEYTDILLCHDDELEKRRFAYIYYLVPSTWSDEDGGQLDLFTADHHIQPKEIYKSIVPKRNNFLCFEVTETSFHQVTEILSLEKTRLSISGWFHGPPLHRRAPYIEPLPRLSSYITVDEEEFYSWINPLYLLPDIQGEISEKFEAESEIQLTDFLQKDKYEAVKAAIKDSGLHWTCLGPANKRRYYVCDVENRSPIIKQCVKFLHSDAMFLVLSNITGLKLHELAPADSDDENSKQNTEDEKKDTSSSTQSKDGKSDSKNSAEDVKPTADDGVKSNTDSVTSNNDNKKSSVDIEAEKGSTGAVTAQCFSEVRKWSHGCYTLAHDNSSDQDYSLDTILYIDCSDWKTDYGGFTSYIAKDEDDELLSVTPEENCLALVYRDKNTMKFVKHINHRSTQSPQSQFYDISTVYYE